MPSVLLDGGASLRFEDLVSVLERNAVVDLTPEAVRRIQAGRDVIEAYAAEHEVYGFTTGVGVLKTQSLSEPASFQRQILASHATSLEPTNLPVHVDGGGGGGVGGSDADVREKFRSRLRLALTIQLSHYATGCAGVTVSLSRAVAGAIESLRLAESNGARSAEEMIGAAAFVGEAEAVDIDSGAIVVNCRVALWLLDFTGYVPAQGEALPLMSHNTLAIASAACVAVTARTLLACSTASAAATATAFSADLSPFSSATIARSMPGRPRSRLATAQAQCSEALLRLCGSSPSSAGAKQGARLLQDPLSLRTACVMHAAVLCAVDNLCATVEHAANTYPMNPVVIVPGDAGDAGTDSAYCGSSSGSSNGRISAASLLTNPNFDITALRLAVDGALLACTEMGGRSYARMLNMLDPLHNGIGRYDKPAGAHNRNISWICAASWNQARRECVIQPSTPARVADGVEDVSTGLSSAVASAHAGFRHISTVVTCELVVAWEGLIIRGGKGQGSDPIAFPSQLAKVIGPAESLAAYQTEGQRFDLGAVRSHFLACGKTMVPDLFPSAWLDTVLDKEGVPGSTSVLLSKM